MKKLLLKPGFEILFSAGLIAILGLPQLLLAQNHKDVRIVIRNNDTLLNGKNIKDLPAKEKQEAMAQINEMDKNLPNHIRSMEVITRNDNDTSRRVQVYTFGGDSSLGNLRLRFNRPDIDNIDGISRVPEMRSRMGSPGPMMDGMRYSRPSRVTYLRRVNIQSFNYTNTDKNGISTHVSYQVANAVADDLKDITGVTEAKLELSDLMLTPQFSAGKTVLSFGLPAKAPADVRLTDSEGKSLWQDKTTSANYTKSFTWGLNGVYYLIVKQSGRTAVKRIVKED